MRDSKDELIVTANVPSFDAKDLDVHLCGTRLIIEGKHETAEEQKQDDEGIAYSDQRAQRICQVIELPVPVDADKSRAELKER